MNPYREIALRHLSVKELKSVIAEIEKKDKKLEEISDREKRKNEYRKLFRRWVL